MAKNDAESAALKDELADAMAQIESLQAAVADAEARAETQGERAATAQSELEAARAEGEQSATRLRESAIRYREARLAAAPGVPADLVPGDTIEEIDAQMEAAERVVAEMRDRMEKEQREQAPSVPAGAPVRRAPDYSQLPPGEKIKVGLEQASQRRPG